MGGQRSEWQLVEEPADDRPPADRWTTARREPAGMRGHLRAADRAGAAGETRHPAEGVTSLVPYQETTSASPSWASKRERLAQHLGATARLDDQRHALRCPVADELRRFFGRDRLQADATQRPLAGRPWLDGQHPRSRPLEQEAGEDAHDAEAGDDDLLLQDRAGVERDLESGLDQREQAWRARGSTSPSSDHVFRRRGEDVLVGVEGEHELAVGDAHGDRLDRPTQL